MIAPILRNPTHSCREMPGGRIAQFSLQLFAFLSKDCRSQVCVEHILSWDLNIQHNFQAVLNVLFMKPVRPLEENMQELWKHPSSHPEDHFCDSGNGTWNPTYLAYNQVCRPALPLTSRLRIYGTVGMCFLFVCLFFLMSVHFCRFSC